LLSTFTVVNTLDDGSTGSMRWAITQVNADRSKAVDTIDFIDPILGAPVMNTILTIIGPTPDQGLRDEGHLNAVCEWCINTAVINTHNKCAIVNSEDGNFYRWDFTTNSLTARVTLSTGIGELYTPKVIGSDEKVYAINNSTLFACGTTP